jgi:hypothetical protein
MQETINATSGHLESPGGWWSLNGVTGAHDVYMSWWSYLDPTAKVNAESFFGWIQKDTGPINEEQALIMDTEGPNDVLATSDSLWFSPQTNDPVNDCLNTGKPKNCGKYGGGWNLNLGTWEQEELWIHPGTCNGGVPNNDGFIRFYINGQLRFHLDRTQTFDPSPEGSGNSGGNLNGCVDMSSPTINVGGVWTYLDVTNPTTFHKYIDDIIVIKQ